MPETKKIATTNDEPSLTEGVVAPEASTESAGKKSPCEGGLAFLKCPAVSCGSNLLCWSEKFAFPLTIFFVILVLSWFMYFLYNNVYQTIILGQKIPDLKSQVISQELNVGDFNKIVALTEKKKVGAAWRADKINNPFVYEKRLKPAEVKPATSTAASTLPASTTPPSTASSSAPSTSTATKK